MSRLIVKIHSVVINNTQIITLLRERNVERPKGHDEQNEKLLEKLFYEISQGASARRETARRDGGVLWEFYNE